MELEQVSSTLDFLKGYDVSLYVGEETVKGKLVGVEPDHIILESENEHILYFNIEQIQAISKNTKQFQSKDITADFLQTQSMVDLLTSLKDSWVTILCLNKQKFNGIVSNVDKQFATLISGEERILIKISQISNILRGGNKQNQNTNQVDSQNKNEEKQTEFYYEGVINNIAYPSKVILGEMQQIKAPIISETVGKESRVWSQPIKTINEKQSDTSQKNKSELRKTKDQAAGQNQLESKPSVKNEASIGAAKAESKSLKDVKTLKEKKQEPASSTNVSPLASRSLSGENPNLSQKPRDDSRQRNPFDFRFAGEPVSLHELERPPLFSGWPGNSSANKF